jgi:carboxylesterase
MKAMQTMGFRKWLWAAALALGAFAACQINDVECKQDCLDGWMDSGRFPDSCASDSNRGCLVSTRIPNPDSNDLTHPVIIAVHGFTASTYEWEEFKDFADTFPIANKPLVSLVLLGGHGRSIDTFQSSTWRDWGRPILKEYDSLVVRGYKHISFAGASTGATLLIQAIADGAFNNRQVPDRVFLIDPIIVPTAKALSLANIVGPVLGNSPNPGDSVENLHWYVNRPEEDLRQLYELINRAKNHLESGFDLPVGTRAKVYKTKHDNSADPVGALMIYKGMRNSGGGHVEVQMIDSRLHVFTRLQGRSPIPSAADTSNQQSAFRDMAISVQPKVVPVKTP